MILTRSLGSFDYRAIARNALVRTGWRLWWAWQVSRLVLLHALHLVQLVLMLAAYLIDRAAAVVLPPTHRHLRR